MNIMKHYGKKFQTFKRLVKNERPILVEIGSHYGEDSLRLIKTFPKSRLYCFEPDERNIKIFNKLINQSNVKLIEKAVSFKTGKAKFYRSFVGSNEINVPHKYNFILTEDYSNLKLNGSGASSLKKGFPQCLNENKIVETIRFDDWYYQEEIQNIDLVWIDVQGAEKDVIDSMGKMIKNINYIWMEYGEEIYEDALNRKDTIQLLETKGFVLNSMYSDSGTQGDLLFENELIIGNY